MQGIFPAQDIRSKANRQYTRNTCCQDCYDNNKDKKNYSGAHLARLLCTTAEKQMVVEIFFNDMCFAYTTNKQTWCAFYMLSKQFMNVSLYCETGCTLLICI